MEHTAQNLKETCELADDFAKSIKKQEQKATVIALYGNLGSGKTSFVQGVAKTLGIKKTVISPTFVIERIYALEGESWKRFVHIDCYRFEKASEVKSIDWDEIIKEPDNLIFIEWADKIENELPKDSIKIYFEFVNENTRKISIKI